MRKILFALLACLAFASFANATIDFSAWSFGRPISVWLGSGATPQGYPVSLNISYNTDMSYTNMSDVRFLDSSQNIFLNFTVIKIVPGQWMNVTVNASDNVTTTNGTIWMIYHNLAADDNQSNCSATYDFCRDFESGSLADCAQELQVTELDGNTTSALTSKYGVRQQSLGAVYRLACKIPVGISSSQKQLSYWSNTSEATSRGRFYVNYTDASTTDLWGPASATFTLNTTNASTGKTLDTAKLEFNPAVAGTNMRSDNLIIRKWIGTEVNYWIGAQINLSTGTLFSYTYEYNTTTSELATEVYSLNVSSPSGNITNASAVLYWNNTAYPQSNVSTWVFNQSIIIPTVSASTNVTVVWLLNLSYANGTTFLFNTSTPNVTISAIGVNTSYGCGPVFLAINFTTEESPFTPTVSSLDSTFFLRSLDGLLTKNVSANLSGSNNYTFCFTPSDKSYLVDSFQQYYASGFNVRAYFLSNATLTNSTSNLTFYLANDTVSKNTEITVTDSNGLPVTGGYVSIQRYYPATNSYFLVAMVKTDNFGNGQTYLTPNDVFYRFIVTEDYVVTGTFSSRQIICSAASAMCNVNLQLGSGTIGEYFNYIGSVAQSCYWNPTTNLTGCTVSDGSGLFHSWTLTVTKLGMMTNTVTCTQTIYTSSGTLTCAVPDTGEYSATLTASGSVYVGDTYSFINGVISNALGTSAIFFGLVITLTIGFAAWSSLGAGVLMMGLGVAFAKILGFIALSTGMTVIIFFLALLVAWKLWR